MKKEKNISTTKKWAKDPKEGKQAINTWTGFNFLSNKKKCVNSKYQTAKGFKKLLRIGLTRAHRHCSRKCKLVQLFRGAAGHNALKSLKCGRPLIQYFHRQYWREIILGVHKDLGRRMRIPCYLKEQKIRNIINRDRVDNYGRKL